MSYQPAFTRREFLNSSLLVVSTIGTVPTFLNRQALAMGAANNPLLSSQPGQPDDRILLVVQLSGGNDGLNTVIPYGMGEYYNGRAQIAVAKEQVLQIDKTAGIGLHPELADLKEMLDAGRASIIQGVGYPNPNRSHFASMDIWHTADTRGGKGTGWLGKALDEVAVDKKTGAAEPTACICVGHDPILAAQGRITQPIAFENANLFRWAGGGENAKLGPAYDKFNRAGVLDEIPKDDNQAAFVMRTALDAQIASDRVRAAVSKGNLTTFPGGQLSQQLKMVASMIRANMPTRVYYVALGGFDTHSGQTGRHGQLLRQFGQGMKAFYNEMKAMGQEDRVVTVSFSEFGRRVAQNASNGTDHGTAGPMFMFGTPGTIQTGLLGTHPSLSRDKLDNGDLTYNTDFRSVYASVLDGWLKVDSKKILGESFKRASVLNPKVG